MTGRSTIPDPFMWIACEAHAASFAACLIYLHPAGFDWSSFISEMLLRYWSTLTFAMPFPPVAMLLAAVGIFPVLSLRVNRFRHPRNNRHRTFPESQFENYRRLGFHAAESAIDSTPGPDLGKVFEQLAGRCISRPENGYEVIP